MELAITMSFMLSLPFQQDLNFYVPLLKVSFAKTPFFSSTSLKAYLRVNLGE